MSRQTLLAILGGAILLAGCADIPDFRRGEGLPRLTNPFASRPAESIAPALPAGPPVSGPSADFAERACIQAGQGAGFEVQGVVGTREVRDAAGLATSRDVVLRARRGGQSLEVRCSYSYASASARIMTL